jgi:hypothetical protein
MTGFFECAPIIGRHSTAVLLTNHTKPALNTRVVKNNTFFFAIVHALRVIKRSTHWSNRDGFKQVKSRVWCHKARVTHWPTETTRNTSPNITKGCITWVLERCSPMPCFRGSIGAGPRGPCIRSKSRAHQQEDPAASRRTRAALMTTGCTGYDFACLDRQCTQPDVWLSASTSSRAAVQDHRPFEHQRVAGAASTGNVFRSGTLSLCLPCPTTRWTWPAQVLAPSSSMFSEASKPPTAIALVLSFLNRRYNHCRTAGMLDWLSSPTGSSHFGWVMVTKCKSPAWPSSR